MSFSTLVSNTFCKWTGRDVKKVDSRDSQFPDVSEAPIDSRRIIRNRKYCQLLSNRTDLNFDDVSIRCAWQALQHEMAYVPGGSVRLLVDELAEEDRRYCLRQNISREVPVASFFLDRDCITNADYFRFVQAGGYDIPELWPQNILPFVQFVDRTGNTGPRFWSEGKPPSDKPDHPVVGICWYEANAYAQWTGKRLPTSAEWQHAGTWPQNSVGGGSTQRYPWGNAFEHSRANLWTHNRCETVPVDAFGDGNTPNGVRQLIGNVWEWIDTQYCPACEGTVKVILSESMAEIRGGAFDTYFASQATCQFRTGQPILSRSNNVGFRCCVSTSDLRSPESCGAEENNS